MIDFRITCSKFKSVLKELTPAVGLKTANPMMSQCRGFRIYTAAAKSEVWVDASDGHDLFMSMRLPATELNGPDDAAIPDAKRLGKALGAFDPKDVIHVCLDDGRITMNVGERVVSVDSISTDSHGTGMFPDVPEVYDGPSVAIRADVYGLVSRAASQDGSRPILCGVAVTRGGLAACDSYRLAWTVDGGVVAYDGDEFILPAFLSKLLGKGIVHGHVDGKRAFLKRADGAELVVRVIEGEFPSWGNLVKLASKSSVCVVPDPVLFGRTAKRFTTMFPGTLKAVQLVAHIGKLGLEFYDDETSMTDAVPATWHDGGLLAVGEDESLTFPCNPKFLSEGVQLFVDAGVTEPVAWTVQPPRTDEKGVTRAMDPGVLSSAGYPVRYLLMPIRVS